MSEREFKCSRQLDGAPVIEIVPSIAPESFGLGYAALNLAAALESNGVNVFLACVDSEKDAREACEAAKFPYGRLVRGSLIGPSRLRVAPLMVQQLLNITKDARAIVHVHGMWTFMSYAAGVLRRRLRCPLVLSPHGEMAPFALKISPWKKALASKLYARRNITEASCLCALSEQEKDSIRASGFTGRVEIIASGVRTRHSVAPGARILLFLSRIARIKNLPLLLRAFARNVATQPGWILLIAGSDECGHIHEVRTLVSELGIEKSVRIIGQVRGREKARTFTSASVFVLPSYSEGLPIVALEAMEYGKPLLLTDVWELPVMTNANFSWRVPVDDRAFENALHDVMNTPEELLNVMGRDARSVVRQHFGWNAAATKACSLYSSLLAGDREGRSCQRSAAPSIEQHRGQTQ
jgi:glycosyltransferase involved in cell wall biosynthesis